MADISEANWANLPCVQLHLVLQQNSDNLVEQSATTRHPPPNPLTQLSLRSRRLITEKPWRTWCLLRQSSLFSFCPDFQRNAPALPPIPPPKPPWAPCGVGWWGVGGASCDAVQNRENKRRKWAGAPFHGRLHGCSSNGWGRGTEETLIINQHAYLKHNVWGA